MIDAHTNNKMEVYFPSFIQDCWGCIVQIKNTVATKLFWYLTLVIVYHKFSMF